MLISSVILMGPAGPAQANGLPEAYETLHGPPKVHGPRGHCSPCPPLGALVADSQMSEIE